MQGGAGESTLGAQRSEQAHWGQTSRLCDSRPPRQGRCQSGEDFRPWSGLAQEMGPVALSWEVGM